MSQLRASLEARSASSLSVETLLRGEYQMSAHNAYGRGGGGGQKEIRIVRNDSKGRARPAAKPLAYCGMTGAAARPEAWQPLKLLPVPLASCAVRRAQLRAALSISAARVAGLAKLRAVQSPMPGVAQMLRLSSNASPHWSDQTEVRERLTAAPPNVDASKGLVIGRLKRICCTPVHASHSPWRCGETARISEILPLLPCRNWQDVIGTAITHFKYIYPELASITQQ